VLATGSHLEHDLANTCQEREPLRKWQERSHLDLLKGVAQKRGTMQIEKQFKQADTRNVIVVANAASVPGMNRRELKSVLGLAIRHHHPCADVSERP